MSREKQKYEKIYLKAFQEKYPVLNNFEIVRDEFMEEWVLMRKLENNYVQYVDIGMVDFVDNDEGQGYAWANAYPGGTVRLFMPELRKMEEKFDFKIREFIPFYTNYGWAAGDTKERMKPLIYLFGEDKIEEKSEFYDPYIESTVQAVDYLISLKNVYEDVELFSQTKPRVMRYKRLYLKALTKSPDFVAYWEWLKQRLHRTKEELQLELKKIYDKNKLTSHGIKRRPRNKVNSEIAELDAYISHLDSIYEDLRTIHTQANPIYDSAEEYPIGFYDDLDEKTLLKNIQDCIDRIEISKNSVQEYKNQFEGDFLAEQLALLKDHSELMKFRIDWYNQLIERKKEFDIDSGKLEKLAERKI